MVRPAEFNFIRSFSTKINKQKSYSVKPIITKTVGPKAEFIFPRALEFDSQILVENILFFYNFIPMLNPMNIV